MVILNGSFEKELQQAIKGTQSRIDWLQKKNDLEQQGVELIKLKAYKEVMALYRVCKEV